MRKLALIMCNVLLTILVMAQNGKVSGIIKDKETKEPLIGVNIMASKTIAVELTEIKGTTSDIDGNYELTLPVGNYVIEFKYLGYETARKRVRINNGSDLVFNIEMGIEAKDLGLVTVSASKYEKKYGEESVTVEVLTPDFIQNTNTTSLDQALDKVPGVNMIGETVNIRGGAGYTSTAGSRVLMLLDGIPLLIPQSDGIDFGSLPLENIRQVEVIKGASSTLYGSSALNGTINIITENPKNKPYSRINTYYGVYENPFKGDKKDLYWSDLLPKVYGLSFVDRRKIRRTDLTFDGAYDWDESYLYKNRQSRARFNFKTRFRPKNQDRLTLGFNTNLSYHTGDYFFLWNTWDTTAVGDSLAYVPNETANMKEFPVNVDPFLTYFDKKGNKHNIKGRYYYFKSRSSDGENTDANLTYGEYTFHSALKSIGLNFITGLSSSYTFLTSEVFSKRKSKNGAVFLQVDKTFFDRLTITGGFRAELYKLDTLDLKVRPIGRGGINLRVGKASYFRGSFGQGYRYPSIAERFAVIIRAGQYVVPNENLKPESSWSAELGFKQGFKISKWFGYLDVSGFVTQYKDMMEYTFAPDSVKTQYFPDAPLFSFAFWSKNITDARISGIEFSAIGQGEIFGVKTNFLIGYTYLVPIDRNYDPELPQYADRTNMLNYRFRHSAKGDVECAYKGLTVGLTAFINSFMENVDPLVEITLSPPTRGIKIYREQNKRPTYSLDARIGYNVTEEAKVSLIAKNVTNTQNMLRPGYLEAPRNYSLQFSYEF